MGGTTSGRSAFLALLVCLAMTATACSTITGGNAGSSDGALGSDTTPAGAAIDGGATVADPPGPLPPLFTADRPEAISEHGAGFTLNGIVGDPSGDGSFYAIGNRLDVDARKQTARLVHVINGTDEFVDLPSDADEAGANDVAVRDDGTIVVAGWQTIDGSGQPVVWTGDGQTFTAEQLPADDQPSWAYEVSDDGTVVSGAIDTGDSTQPVVWTEAVGGWDAVTIPIPGTDDGATVHALHRVTDDTVIAVGETYTTGSRDRTTGFWLIADGVATPVVPPGIDSDTRLTGITALPSGELIAVGGRIGPEAEPAVYRTDGYDPSVDPAGTWTATTPEVDTGQYINSGGRPLGGVVADDERVLIWTSFQAVIQALESTDNGRSWTQLGDFTTDTNLAFTQGFGLSGDATASAVGLQLYKWNERAADYWSNGAWQQVRSTWTEAISPDYKQKWYSIDQGRITAATLAFDDPVDLEGQLTVWSSDDGATWVADQVPRRVDLSTIDLARVNDEPWIFGNGGTVSHDPLELWRYDHPSSAWVGTEYEPLEGTRSLVLDSVGTDDGALVVTAEMGENDRIVPRWIDLDGSATVGSFGIDMPESSSVDCLEAVDDGFAAVVRPSGGSPILLTSDDGMSWVTADNDLGDRPVADCRVEDGTLIVGSEQDDGSFDYQMAGTDGADNEPSLPDDAHTIIRVVTVAGTRVALGQAKIGEVVTAALWAETDEGWRQLSTDESGLTPDAVGYYTSPRNLSLLPDEVVLTGFDDTGYVLWRAPRDEFFQRMGITDDGSVTLGPEADKDEPEPTEKTETDDQSTTTTTTGTDDSTDGTDGEA